MESLLCVRFVTFEGSTGRTVAWQLHKVTVSPTPASIPVANEGFHTFAIADRCG